MEVLKFMAFWVAIAASVVWGGICGRKAMEIDFAKGDLKVYSWSNVEQLNAELAKGYKIRETYNVTNTILEKISK